MMCAHGDGTGTALARVPRDKRHVAGRISERGSRNGEPSKKYRTEAEPTPYSPKKHCSGTLNKHNEEQVPHKGSRKPALHRAIPCTAGQYVSAPCQCQTTSDQAARFSQVQLRRRALSGTIHH